MAVQYVYPLTYQSGINFFDDTLLFRDQDNSIIYWGGSLSGIDEGVSSPNDADFIYPVDRPVWEVGSFDNGYFDFKYGQSFVTTSGLDVELRIKSSGYNYAVIAEVYDGEDFVGTSNYVYFSGNQVQSNVIPISISNPKRDVFNPIVRYKFWTSGTLDANPNSNVYITASDLKISGQYISPSSISLAVLGGLEICQPEDVGYVDADNSSSNALTNNYFTYLNNSISHTGSNLFATTTSVIPSSIFNHSLFLINEGSGTVFYSCNSNVSGTINSFNSNIWDFNGNRI